MGRRSIYLIFLRLPFVCFGSKNNANLRKKPKTKVDQTASSSTATHLGALLHGTSSDQDGNQQEPRGKEIQKRNLKVVYDKKG